MPPKQQQKKKKEKALANGCVASTVLVPTKNNEAITPYPIGKAPLLANYTLLRQDLGHNIHVIDNFLLPNECAAWIHFGESKGFEIASQEETGEYAYRNNGRLQIVNPEVALRLFQRLVPFLPSSLDGAAPWACSSNIRIYRYEEGQRFGRHIDESHEVEVGRKKGETKYTLLVYLNGNESCDPQVSGGHTIFYTSHTGQQLTSIAPSLGRLLLHGHGRRCLTHEGAQVTSGVKYLLRTDVIYAK